MLHALVLAAEEAPNPILPDPAELIYGSLAFLLVFVVLARFAFPVINRMLQVRTAKIEGDLERAERAAASRIIEEARRTAEQLRRDLHARAEQESQATIGRAQEEIRAERDQ